MRLAPGPCCSACRKDPGTAGGYCGRGILDRAHVFCFCLGAHLGPRAEPTRRSPRSLAKCKMPPKSPPQYKTPMTTAEATMLTPTAETQSLVQTLGT